MALNSEPQFDEKPLQMLLKTIDRAPVYRSETRYKDVWDCLEPVEKELKTEEIILHWNGNEIPLDHATTSIGYYDESHETLPAIVQIAQLIVERGEPTKLSYKFRHLIEAKDTSKLPYDNEAYDKAPFKTVKDDKVEETFPFTAVQPKILETLKRLANKKNIVYAGQSVPELSQLISKHDYNEAVDLFLKHSSRAPLSYYRNTWSQGTISTGEEVTLLWKRGDIIEREMKLKNALNHQDVYEYTPQIKGAESIHKQIQKFAQRFGEPTHIKYSLKSEGGLDTTGDDVIPPPYGHRNINVVIPFVEVRDRFTHELQSESDKILGSLPYLFSK